MDEVMEMFDWDNKDTKYVFRMRSVFIILLYILIFGSVVFVLYLRYTAPFIFPLGGYFYLMQYSFSLRLVYLIPSIILAAHIVVTPLTVFLLAVFVTSCVLYFTRFWDIGVLRSLRNFRGYERYKDAKAFVRSFASRGAEGRTFIIAVRTLSAFALLFVITLLLSVVMMANSEVIQTLSLLVVLTMGIYIMYTLLESERIESLVQQKTGDTGT